MSWKQEANPYYLRLQYHSIAIDTVFVPSCSGEMAERLNAAALKAAVRATGPWVQIPLSPPFIYLNLYDYL